ncbi:hypothetical protein [Cerasicoccus maritimus]|nr:hypothetical protein [Cerasicoccus maritimus]
MEFTQGLNVVIYGMGCVVLAALAMDMWLEFRWSRQAQSMHAKTPQEK